MSGTYSDFAWWSPQTLQEQMEQEYLWLLDLRGAHQRFYVRVIRPTIRLLTRLAMLYLRSEPRWRRGRWKAKT